MSKFKNLIATTIFTIVASQATANTLEGNIFIQSLKSFEYNSAEAGGGGGGAGGGGCTCTCGAACGGGGAGGGAGGGKGGDKKFDGVVWKSVHFGTPSPFNPRPISPEVVKYENQYTTEYSIYAAQGRGPNRPHPRPRGH